MTETQCSICKKPVALSQAYRLVEGWERVHRAAGGTNALRCRKPKEVFACEWCVAKQAAGLAGQESLL